MCSISPLRSVPPLRGSLALCTWHSCVWRRTESRWEPWCWCWCWCFCCRWLWAECLSCCLLHLPPLARAFIPVLYTRRPRCVTELPRARPFSTYTRGNTACPPIHARCRCGMRWASRGCGSPLLHVEERFRNSQWVSSFPPSIHPSILNWSSLQTVLLACRPDFWFESCEWQWMDFRKEW